MQKTWVLNFSKAWIPHLSGMTAPLLTVIYEQAMGANENITWSQEDHAAFTKTKLSLMMSSFARPFKAFCSDNRL